MAVLAKNERANPWRWTTGKRGQNDKFLMPGETAVLSDDEFAEVPIAMRGSGGIKALSPSTIDPDDLNKVRFDYFTVFSTIQIHYLGESLQAVADSDPFWIVKRFDYVDAGGGDIRISEIQVLEGVAWQDRASLAWS